MFSSGSQQAWDNLSRNKKVRDCCALRPKLPQVTARQCIPGRGCVCPTTSRCHHPPTPGTRCRCQFPTPGVLLAELPWARERGHTRTGPIGVGVRKDNVPPALPPGLLQGPHRDWDESTDDKGSRGGRAGWGGGDGQVTASQKYVTSASAKNNMQLFSPKAEARVRGPHSISLGISPSANPGCTEAPEAGVVLGVPKPILNFSRCLSALAPGWQPLRGDHCHL